MKKTKRILTAIVMSVSMAIAGLSPMGAALAKGNEVSETSMEDKASARDKELIDMIDNYQFTSEITEIDDASEDPGSMGQVAESGENPVKDGDTDNHKDTLDMGSITSEINRGASKKIRAWGVDVYRGQGTIDWVKAKNAGVYFAIIRVGYRGSGTGKIVMDGQFENNVKNAKAAGVHIGLYFSATALNEDEAREEAAYVISMIKKYDIPVTYPIAYDYEAWENETYRNHNITYRQRNDCAYAFLDAIRAYGYTPMMYASKGGFRYNNNWEASKMENMYKMWVAQYPKNYTSHAQAILEGAETSYTGRYDIWQFSDDGLIDGIPNHTDVDFEYEPGVGVTCAARALWIDDDGGNLISGYLQAYGTYGYTMEYSFWVTNDKGKTYHKIQDWSTNPIFDWNPNLQGDLTLVGKVRLKEMPAYESYATDTYFIGVIEATCQMPYTGQGGGYLIGLKTKDYAGTDLKFELLIYDCNLQTWVWSTGICETGTNSFWALWQPIYGYYWTLFRVYDNDGDLLEEQCYGFVNAW